MKKTSLIAALLALTSTAAQAETITASVNGLVCSFCATGIEKILKAQPAVADVKVTLEEGKVIITTKADATLADTQVTQLITDAGFSITDISRSE